ncbi:hypothetical protein MYXO_00728 [Myxococcaceae bacterium]|nr:hypothetical protein MYXO_00728 [Myxococcaceae bacterium]
MQPVAADALEASLGRVRLATLGLLATCAILAWANRSETSDLPPALERLVVPVSLAITVGIFVVRQVAIRARGRSRLRALLATYLLSGGLGVLGALLALAGDDGSRGAALALAGAIFALGTAPGLGLRGAPSKPKR